MHVWEPLFKGALSQEPLNRQDLFTATLYLGKDSFRGSFTGPFKVQRFGPGFIDWGFTV